MAIHLENVVGWGREKDTLMVTMKYIGRILSVNYYRTQNRYTGGLVIRHKVERWMEDLAWVVEFELGKKPPKPPIKILVEGYFKDNRSVPDLANLHYVIGNAVQNGLSINDREFRFQDGDVKVGLHEPVIKITVGAK